jgi:hypothetical protein
MGRCGHLAATAFSEMDRLRRQSDAQRAELEKLRFEKHELMQERHQVRVQLNRHINLEVRRNAGKRLASQAEFEFTDTEKQLREFAAAHELMLMDLDEERRKNRRLLGEGIDNCSGPELLALREQLREQFETAQERVSAMLERRAAEALVVEAEALVVNKFPDYKCSLSLMLMRDPVMTADGQSYERKEIEQWFRTCKNVKEPVTSPLRAPLASDALWPNNNLRRAIELAVEHELGLLGAGGAAGAAKRTRGCVGRRRSTWIYLLVV